MRTWLSPRLLGAHLLGLVCVGVAVAAGLWQYDAWDARREAERIDLTNAEPVPLTDVLGPDDPFPAADVGRPVTFTGTWLPEGTVLVDGRGNEDGEDGVWVVTPLTVGDPDDPAVPVVRGWLGDEDGASGATEADVVPLPEGTATLTGWLQPPEGTGETDPEPGDDVVPQLRTADLVQRVDQDLYGAYVVLDVSAGAERRDAGTTGLEPATLDQLPEAGRFTALRNLLYAVEWWVFAAFAAFIWWRYVRDATAEATDGEATERSAIADDVASSS